MKQILLFNSNTFNYLQEQDRELPLGKELAEFFREKLTNLGICVSSLIEATEGWEIDITVNGERITIFIHWAPVGFPPKDHWVLQPRKRRSFLAAIFRKPPPIENISKFRELIQEVLSEDLYVQHARWIDDEEFKKLY